MKTSIILLLFIILFQSCSEKPRVDTKTDYIKEVENGLTTFLQIEGDTTWNIEERMAHYGVPGVSIAVIYKGEIAWTKGYGVMDKESKNPVTDQTLFQASALSIPVSAYGALQLVDQGKVTLDENINTYLKSWQLPETEFTKEKKATIRNILNHSAGITLHATPDYSPDAEIPTLIQVLNGTAPAENEPIMVNREPDVSFYISYTGYGIIQQMMMDVEGKPFPALMDDLVLQPLGMTKSTFEKTLSEEQLINAATAYQQDGSMVNGRRYVHPVSAGRGLWTTPKDLAKFLIHLQQTLRRNRKEGLSKEMAELMVTPYSKSSYGPGFEYGLGMQIFDRGNATYLRHWGWNQGFFAEMIAHKDQDYGVVVMTNTTFPNFNSEVIRAVAQAYDWEDFIPQHKRVQIEQALIGQIEGRYQGDEDLLVEVFQKDDLLFIENIKDEQTEELIRVSDSVFVRRNARNLIQFRPNAIGGTMELVYLDRNTKEIVTALVKE